MRIQKALGKVFLGAALALMLQAGLAAADDAVQTKDCGWCVITCPKEVAPGASFDVKVELKGLAEKTKLGSDLHWMKEDGSWGGCLAWGGGAKDVEKDGVLTFSYKFDAKEGMGAAHAIVYLSPDGTWDKQTKNTTGPSMSLKSSQ